MCYIVRGRLRRAMTSHRFHVLIVSLVIVDSIIVIAELLFDLKILGLLSSSSSAASSVMRTTNKPTPPSPAAAAAAAKDGFIVPDVL